jgi:hypothetical protein
VLLAHRLRDEHFTYKLRQLRYARLNSFLMNLFLTSLSALLASHMTQAFAATIVLTPTQDATLYNNPSPADSNNVTGVAQNGAGAGIFTGATVTLSPRRALVQFDVAGSVPAGSVINSVTLTLRVAQTVTGSTPVSVHRSVASWVEGTVDAPGGEGEGAVGAQNGATWTLRFPGQNWTANGGDYISLASATTSVAGETTEPQWTSAQMAADVQAWLNTPSQNFGWLLRGDENQQSAKRYFSSENTTNAAFSPRLSIQYTVVPEPSALILTLASLGLLGCRRRRSIA